MPRLDDSGMDRPDRNLEDTFALDVAERVLSLLPFQHGIPQEILLQGMRALGPVLVTDQPAQVRMSLGDEAEHVPDFPLVPLGGMNVRRDGAEEPIIAVQVRAQQQPLPSLLQSKQVQELAPRLARPMVHGPQERERPPQTRMRVHIMGDDRQVVLSDTQHRRPMDGTALPDTVRERRLQPFDHVRHAVTSLRRPGRSRPARPRSPEGSGARSRRALPG